MRPVLLLAAACLVGGCSGSLAAHDPSSSGPAPVGSTRLAMLCPEVHVLVDSLVASTPDSQHEFVVQLDRLWGVADQQSRDSLQVLLDAARTLEKAGVGDGFYAARDGIHAAVVAVNADCVKVGAPPILHSGPHPVS